MWPLAAVIALATPRRWLCLFERIIDWGGRALSFDTTGLARVLRPVVGVFSSLRRALVGRIGLLARLDWAARKLVWSIVWASTVATRSRPKRASIPRDERPMRLIPAPETYPDFAAPKLRVPAGVPCAEASLPERIAVQMIHLLQDVYPIIAEHQPPASFDPEERLRSAWTWIYSLVRPPPVWHRELVDAARDKNLLGALAIGGPFAKLLECVDASEGTFVIDLEHMQKYEVREGLKRLGCRIDYRAEGGRLRVAGIVYQGERAEPGDERFAEFERVALCALVTHGTVWNHGMQYHVGGLAPVAAVSHNLPADHPLRRLLAPHIAETMSTNYHTHLTLRRSGFDVTGFSFTRTSIYQYYDDGVEAFRMARLDPRLSIAARKIPGSLIYPYREQAYRYIELVEDYVRAYVVHVYPSEDALERDPHARIWYESVDSHVRGGVRQLAPRLDRENLIRLCAVFIYSVTVEHEENTLWDYAVFMPGALRADGGRQSAGEVQNALNFQLLISSAQNRLMADWSHLALDPKASDIMRGFQSKLLELQKEMEASDDHYWTIYPAELEASVSA